MPCSLLRRSVRTIAIVSVLAVGLTLPRISYAQDKPIASDVKKYLQQLVNGLRQYRVGRDEIDWGQVESKTMAAAAGAQTIPDAFPAIRVALAEIKDPWAMYHAATGQNVGPDAPRCIPSRVTAPTVPTSVGYIRVAPIPARGTRAEREAAVAIRAALKTADDAGAENWIVDLRGHFMGSLPAPVMGLAPLMGDGTVFKMEYADAIVPFNADQTSIKANGQEMAIDGSKFSLTHKKPRVAVLVDGGTAGVGELLTVAFENRDNARVFGTATCGIPPLRLVPQKLKDGAEFTLSAMRIIDRLDKRYRGPIEPHERIETETALFERVLAWVNTGK